MVAISFCQSKWVEYLEKMSEGQIFLMAISAIIACGKSKIMERFRQTKALEEALGEDYVILSIKEPEALWKERIQDPWTGERVEIDHLSTFYTLRGIYAHGFQMKVFDTHIQVIEQAVEQAKRDFPHKKVIILVERSMYDQLLFWKQQMRDNLETATLAHHASYMSFWRRWNTFIPPPSLIFFLKTSNLDKTMRRLKNREENKKQNCKNAFHVSVDGTERDIQEVGGITRKYQSDLLELHEAFYTTPFARPPESPEGGIPCIHLDADLPYHEQDDSLFQMAREMAPHMIAVMNGTYGEHEGTAVPVVEM